MAEKNYDHFEKGQTHDETFSCGHVLKVKLGPGPTETPQRLEFYLKKHRVCEKCGKVNERFKDAD